MNRLIIFIVSLIVFCSCYNDLNLDKYRPDPTVVLNSAISSDTVVMASVGRTVFFTDYRDVDPTIRDADVNLYVNGAFREKMIWIADTNLVAGGIYKSKYVPNTNDKIKIEANTMLGKAWGEDILPKQTEIENVNVSYIEYENPNSTVIGPNGTHHGINYKITYDISFTDNPSTKNYYCIRIESGGGQNVNGLLDYSEDAVFIAQRPILDSSTTDKSISGQSGLTFTDEIINGKSYKMRITETESKDFYHYGKHQYRRVILYSLSESYYKYLKGILNDNEGSVSGSLINFGLSEPPAHFTNIQGGLGILATMQSSKYLFDLRTIFPDYWE